MTDRLNAFVVILEKDLRTDDAEDTLNAIRQIKGVLDVKPRVREIEDMVAYARARHDLHMKLYDALKDDNHEV